MFHFLLNPCGARVSLVFGATEFRSVVDYCIPWLEVMAPCSVTTKDGQD